MSGGTSIPLSNSATRAARAHRHQSAGRFLGATALWLAITAVSGIARGDDWPQWLGPQRDGVWRETGIVERFPEAGPKVRWRAKVESGYTGPAVSSGRVYVMDRVLAEGAKNHPEPFPQRPRQGIAGTERVLCLS